MRAHERDGATSSTTHRVRRFCTPARRQRRSSHRLYLIFVQQDLLFLLFKLLFIIQIEKGIKKSHLKKVKRFERVWCLRDEQKKHKIAAICNNYLLYVEERMCLMKIKKKMIKNKPELESTIASSMLRPNMHLIQLSDFVKLLSINHIVKRWFWPIPF